jgi:hypothetical protein
MPHVVIGKRPEYIEELKLEKHLKQEVQSKKHALFNGRFYREKVGPFFSWIFTAIGGHLGDKREWDLIDK